MGFTLILASSSVYRKAQLSQLVGEGFACVSPDIDESLLDKESAEELSLRLSLEKAQCVAKHQLECEPAKHPLIIAGDQSAACEGRILGKPGSIKAAREQLAYCSHKEVIFYSGLCLLRPDNGWHRIKSVETRVCFRQLSPQEISAYVTREHVLNCAGSFKCEGLGIALFSAIQSEDPSALVGLPLIALNAFLIEAGFNPLLENAT